MILTYPSNLELMTLQQEFLPTLTMDDLAFDLLPPVNHDAAYVEWEQRDRFTGVMQIRGMDGEPPSAPVTGWKRYKMEPGVYGEWVAVNESDIIQRRTPGTFNVPIPIDDLVVEKQDYLLSRRIDRLRWIIWTLLITGTFNVPGPNGNVLHAGTFTVQTTTVGTLWTDYALSTPLKDLRATLLKFRGISASFGPNSMLVMNRVTANHMLSNNNAADLGGRRSNYGETMNNIDFVNNILATNDLPRVRVYDLGYFPDGAGAAFTPFIPDGKVLMIGQRPNGETLGEFQFTRNASNADAAPGPYTYVSDSLDTGRPIPRRIRVDDGFNGGPAMFFPSLIIVLTVF